MPVTPYGGWQCACTLRVACPHRKPANFQLFDLCSWTLLFVNSPLCSALNVVRSLITVASSSPSFCRIRTQYFAFPLSTTSLPSLYLFLFATDLLRTIYFGSSPAALHLALCLHCALRLLSLRPPYPRYRPISSFGSRRLLRSEIFQPDHVVKKKRPPLSSLMIWA